MFRTSCLSFKDMPSNSNQRYRDSGTVGLCRLITVIVMILKIQFVSTE